MTFWPCPLECHILFRDSGFYQQQHSAISHVCLINIRIGYFSIITKLHFLFGYFTQFVNSGNSHLCKFAYLPPTRLRLLVWINTDSFIVTLIGWSRQALVSYFVSVLSRAWLLTDKELQLWTETEQDRIRDNSKNRSYNRSRHLIGSIWARPNLIA